VLVSSEGQQALFLGALALSFKNLEHPGWGDSWAWSREADEENRCKVAEWAVDDDAIPILYHYPRRACFRLGRADDGYRAIPLEM